MVDISKGTITMIERIYLGTKMPTEAEVLSIDSRDENTKKTGKIDSKTISLKEEREVNLLIRSSFRASMTQIDI